MSAIRFELAGTDPSGARAGVLHTRRGPAETPLFMPVGTHAAVRCVDLEDVKGVGARVLLANTYHLMLRPGCEVFERVGGIHRFMKWGGGVLTDSGGYQIFSLPTSRDITEEGAAFRSFDNRAHMLSPERSIAVQQAIGSDIMMVLDVCVESTTDEAGTRDAMERTHRWALRSLAAKRARDTGQALFAIVQGGVHPPLRLESAAFLTAHDFDGFAIGGLAVGETKREREDMTELVTAALPPLKPRYLMGVGTPLDLLEAVRRGVDMFDCILPTKMAQQGQAYTFRGKLKMGKEAFRFDEGPIDSECDCVVCRTQSRAYVQHLLKAKQAHGPRMIAIHNLRHYQMLMARMRAAIVENRFAEFHRETTAAMTRAEKNVRVVAER